MCSYVEIVKEFQLRPRKILLDKLNDSFVSKLHYGFSSGLNPAAGNSEEILKPESQLL